VIYAEVDECMSGRVGEMGGRAWVVRYRPRVLSRICRFFDYEVSRVDADPIRSRLCSPRWKCS